MSGFLRILQRFLGPQTQPSKTASGFAARAQDLSRFAEGDRVLIDRKKLSGPLQHGQRVDTPAGFINHNDIIGQKSARSRVTTNTGKAFEVAYPTLDEYVALAPRKVTPVYASYASLIIALLDIHVSPPPRGVNGLVSPIMEILESGTGHGSLTLHLARAIAAANATPPFPLPPPPSKVFQQPDPDLVTAWTEWRKTRRAVIHTVELSPTFSSHAEKLIRSFRQAIYWPHIDFYTMPVSDWVASQLSIRSKGKEEIGFLDHVVLDMPGVHRQISSVVQAMKDDALLVVFVPSVTQIGDCVREIENKNLPLVMDKVVEVGEGISNGRIWDVRLVKLRKQDVGVMKEVELTDGDECTAGLSEKEETRIEANTEGGSVFVCRPQVGRMTIGGGFVGVWRKADPALVSREKIRVGKPHRNARTSAVADGRAEWKSSATKEKSVKCT